MTTVLDPTSESRPEQRGSCCGPNRSTVSPSDSSTSPNRVATSSSTESRKKLTDLGASVTRFMKPTFAKPAPVDLRHEIATSCDAVIEALAD